MVWIEGRLSWPPVLALVYATIVTIVTDTVWRLVQAPIALVIGGGLAMLVIGMAAIPLLGRQMKSRRSA